MKTMCISYPPLIQIFTGKVSAGVESLRQAWLYPCKKIARQGEKEEKRYGLKGRRHTLK